MEPPRGPGLPQRGQEAKLVERVWNLPGPARTGPVRAGRDRLRKWLRFGRVMWFQRGCGRCDRPAITPGPGHPPDVQRDCKRAVSGLPDACTGQQADRAWRLVRVLAR